MEEIVVVDVVERSRKVHTWRDGMTMKRVKCETVRHACSKSVARGCAAWSGVVFTSPTRRARGDRHFACAKSRRKIQNSKFDECQDHQFEELRLCRTYCIELPRSW